MSGVQAATSTSSDPYAAQISALEKAAGNDPQYDAMLKQWEEQIQAQESGTSAAASGTTATEVAPATTDDDDSGTPAVTGASSTPATTTTAATTSATSTPAATTTTNNVDTAAKASDSTSSGGSSGDSKIPEQLSKYASDIQAASKATGVPEDEISAVIWDESRGVGSASSTNGGTGETDGGLMQLDPSTFSSLQQQNPSLQGMSMDTDSGNIMGGATLLAQEYKKYGTWDLAERAYNSGEGSVDTSNANVTTTGLGDPNYIQKVDANKQDIDNGTPLPA